jgi:methyl-accepting chemotaxis protein
MSATSEELAAQAEELQTSISFFKVSSSEPRGRTAPVTRLKPEPRAKSKPAEPTAARALRRQMRTTAVAAQQARAQGFALDLAQGGADPDDDEFTGY